MKRIIISLLAVITLLSCSEESVKTRNEKPDKETPIQLSNSEQNGIQSEEAVNQPEIADNGALENQEDLNQKELTSSDIQQSTSTSHDDKDIKVAVDANNPIETPIDTPSVAVKSKTPMVITFNHNKFNELLKKHVNSVGVVNYVSFKTEEGKLNSYLAMLKDVGSMDKWSRDKKLAYYINLYNASTISLILKNYPLKSIMDIQKAWDIPFVKIADKTYTLNDIENKIIRPTFKEPRIHFAVNCAAVSCPKISNKAFTAQNLESLLQANTEAFMKNSQIGVKQDGKKVELSQIFEWYAVDFGGKDNLLKWITANSTLDLSKGKFKGFITYNWELNNK